MAYGIIIIMMTLMAMYALMVNYATNSLSEKLFMLRCAKERRKIIMNANNINKGKKERMLFENSQEINFLEREINTFWAKKFVHGKGIFGKY